IGPCSGLNTDVVRVAFRVTTVADRAGDHRDDDHNDDGEHHGRVDGEGNSGTSSGYFDSCRLWRDLRAR
ncbi:MAG: hypothetical protein V9G12_17940, partial [Microthrixaceae bacterium]